MKAKEIIEDEEIICVGCNEKFPEDMIDTEDEPLCEECLLQERVNRAEAQMDLD